MKRDVVVYTSIGAKGEEKAATASQLVTTHRAVTVRASTITRSRLDPPARVLGPRQRCNHRATRGGMLVARGLR